jgi:[ribosomal protein S5]-alanine N-acetyltransferase
MTTDNTVSPPIETARLRLRRLALDDSAFMLRLLNEPSYLQHIGDRGVRTLAAARAYLRDGPLASYARHGFGLLCVELKAGAAPIGICGLVKRDALPDPDLGYALLPEHWGRGYAFEAASAVLGCAGGALGLARVVAVVAPGNAASIRLLHKLGFGLEGTARLSPDDIDLLLFAHVQAGLTP